jgi:hypothetical protein
MCYKNNVGPQVRRRRYALGWSQTDLRPSSSLPASTSAAAVFPRSKRVSLMLTTRRFFILPRY